MSLTYVYCKQPTSGEIAAIAVSRFFLAHALKVGHMSYAFAHVSIETSNTLLITPAAISLILLLLADKSVMSSTGARFSKLRKILVKFFLSSS